MANRSSEAKNKPTFSLNIGSASILMIFVVLCLVSFAALSTVSALADSRLSTKVLERTTAYYNACNQAEAALEELDTDLAAFYASSASAEAYYKAAGHDRSYTVPVSELQSLDVTVEILYPQKEGDVFYRITGWQVTTAGDLE